jgi:hypothetical protein
MSPTLVPNNILRFTSSLALSPDRRPPCLRPYCLCYLTFLCSGFLLLALPFYILHSALEGSFALRGIFASGLLFIFAKRSSLCIEVSAASLALLHCASLFRRLLRS